MGPYFGQYGAISPDIGRYHLISSDITSYQLISSDIGQYWGDIRQFWGDIGQYRAISGDIEQYRAISSDIGQYWGDIGRYQEISAISEDIGVISSSVKSVMYWARSIQVVPGQLFFQLILSGCVGYVTLRYCSRQPISDDIVNTPCNIAHIWSTVFSPQSTVYCLQSTVYSLQSTVYSIKSTVYSLQSTVYSLHYLESTSFSRQLSWLARVTPHAKLPESPGSTMTGTQDKPKELELNEKTKHEVLLSLHNTSLSNCIGLNCPPGVAVMIQPVFS